MQNDQLVKEEEDFFDGIKTFWKCTLSNFNALNMTFDNFMFFNKFRNNSSNFLHLT